MTRRVEELQGDGGCPVTPGAVAERRVGDAYVWSARVRSAVSLAAVVVGAVMVVAAAFVPDGRDPYLAVLALALGLTIAFIAGMALAYALEWWKKEQGAGQKPGA